MKTLRFPHHLNRLKRDATGVAAVEFALLCPVYLFLVMGMSAYGIYFGAAHSVQQIAADAARAAIPGLTAPERAELATAYVARNAQGYAFIEPARLAVEVGDSGAQEGQFDVMLRYDAGGLPIWNLLERLPLPGKTIRRHSTIRIGGI